MPKLYIATCAVVLLSFAYVSARGIVYTSLITGSGTANKGVTRYHK